MECCAKREKCLYMHSDFPCKYYYLGMKNHNKDNCKFSHGKPLTDQLRNILLKHLETAPKEILGDFPRINRENALNMLNIQHQKLLKEHGMSVPIISPVSSSSSLKLPSLMDVITKRQPLKKRTDSNNISASSGNKINSLEDKITEASSAKLNKPRKTRWCEVTNQQQQQQPQRLLPQSNKSIQSHKSQTVTSSVGLQISSGNPLASTDCINYLSLRHLKGVITLEQINKLALIGIEDLDQINQLTVAQLNEFGLSITQIHELQLNAMNMQKLGLATSTASTATCTTSTITTTEATPDIMSLVQPNPMLTSPTIVATAPVTYLPTIEKSKKLETDILNSAFYMEFGSGGKDLDMRCPPTSMIQPADITR